MKMEELELAADGTLMKPNLHDGHIRGLLLCADKRLLLPVESKEGVPYCLVMHGVERLRADDFRQGNLILDVTVSRGDQIDAAEVAYAFDADPGSLSFLQMTMDRLARDDMSVVRVNPSYGCSAVFICSNVAIETDFLPR